MPQNIDQITGLPWSSVRFAWRNLYVALHDYYSHGRCAAAVLFLSVRGGCRTATLVCNWCLLVAQVDVQDVQERNPPAKDLASCPSRPKWNFSRIQSRAWSASRSWCFRFRTASFTRQVMEAPLQLWLGCPSASTPPSSSKQSSAIRQRTLKYHLRGQDGATVSIILYCLVNQVFLLLVDHNRQ